MIDITRMPYSEAAREYVLRAMGLSGVGVEAAQDEAQVAAERGDAAAYYTEITKQRAGKARVFGGAKMLALMGITEGKTDDRKTLEAILSATHPETGEHLGQAPAQTSSRDALILEKLRAAGGVDNVTEEQARSIIRDVDSQGRRTPAAFYDVTATVPKSFSVLESAAREAGDEALAEGMNAALEAATAQLAERIQADSVARRYAGGSRRAIFDSVADGMVAAGFTHGTSREMDPHLHVHMAVMSKAVCPDGKVRAVDSQAWTAQKMAWDAFFMGALQDELYRHTGLVMQLRPDGVTTEVAGIEQSVLDAFSKRSRQVDRAAEEAVAVFREKHGREPTVSERSRIRNNAAGASKRAKTTLDEDEQRALAWAGVDYDPGAVIAGARAASEEIAEEFDDEVNVDLVIRETLLDLQSTQSTWSRGYLVEGIAKRLPTSVVSRAAEAERIADEVLAGGYGVVHVGIQDVEGAPAELTREADQRPVYVRPGQERYALADHVRAEQRLVSIARQRAPREVMVEADVDALLEQWQAERDSELARRMETYRRAHGEPSAEVRARLERGLPHVPWSDQQQALRRILTTDKAGVVLQAPAGTGKTAVVGFAARAWAATGTNVYGTATSDVATSEMRAAGVPQAMNTAALVNKYGADGGDTMAAGSVLVVDEASMVSAEHMDALQQIATRDGVQLVFVGDVEQFGAVGAGGGLGMLARHNGVDAALEDVVRFDDEWQAEASLRLRERDMSVLDEYARRGRIHAGSEAEVRERIVTSVTADVAAGRQAVVVTGTNAQAQQWNAEIQAALHEAGLLDGDGTVVGETASGVPVMVGADVEWRVPTDPGRTPGVWTENGMRVKNREHLVPIGREGDVVVLTRTEDGTAVRVPVEVFGERAELGWAGTGHAVQGRTVDVSYATEPSYVGMTRGRSENHLVMVTEQEGDPHEAREGRVATVRELVAEYYATGQAEASALDQWLDNLDASAAAPNLTPALEHGTRLAVDTVLREELGTMMPAADVEAMASDTRRWAELCDAVAEAEMRGHDGAALIGEVARERDFWDARDNVAVLRWRMNRAMDERTPARQASTWAQRFENLSRRAGDAGQFVGRVARRMDQRISDAGKAAAAKLHTWATEALGPVPDDERQRAEWELRAGRLAFEREDRGVPDIAPSTGAAPHAEDVYTRVMWEDARRADQRSADPLDLHNLPDSTLELTRSRWRYQRDMAPADVAVQLGEARIEESDTRRQIELLRARLEAEYDDVAAERLARLEERAEHLAARVEMLDEIDGARQRHMSEHASLQYEASEAERELHRRGRVVSDPEDAQLAIPLAAKSSETDPEQSAQARKHLERDQQIAERETEQNVEREVEVDEQQAGLDLDLSVDRTAAADTAVGVGDTGGRHKGVDDVLAVPDMARRVGAEQQRLRDALVHARAVDERNQAAQAERERVAALEADNERVRRERELDAEQEQTLEQQVQLEL